MWKIGSASPYWCIKVNVGLDTASAVATPRPSTIPFVSVVLPAPRLPISSTAPCNSCDSVRPNSTVSSAELVRNVRDGTNPLGQVAQQVRCDDGLFAEMLRGEFSCESMKIDR